MKTYSPFERRYRSQAIRLARHKGLLPVHGWFIGLMLSAMLWILMLSAAAYLIAK